MNVRFGLACLSLLICCWCIATSSVSAASNGVRPRRQNRRATLNEYLTPPALPNAFRGPAPVSRHPRNHGNLGGLQPPPPGPIGPGPSSSSPFRHGKILGPAATEAPGYFSRLMGWLNPFGGGAPAVQRPPPPQLPPQPQQRPDNIHQAGHLNAGYQQPPPPPHSGHGQQVLPWNQPAASYGPPAASYGPPTNSYERFPPGKSPSHSQPQGGAPYLPPARPKNCDPCNHVPWVPLYHGVNAVDSRYAAGSADVRSPESPESTFNQHQGGVTNIYHAPSHEVKTPDFNYGPPQPATALDTNHQASSSSAQFNGNNQNFNFPQTEYRSPFTGPIPNPHLYTGAMPPLFKAKPFDSLPQGTDTSFDPPPNPQLQNHQDTSFSVGPGAANVGSEFTVGSSYDSTNQHYNPSSDLGSPFPVAPNQQYNQQQFQNIGSSFQTTVDEQQHGGQPPHSGGSLDAGYVDELPPGAETVSGFEDNLTPSSFEGHDGNDNGASNSDYRQTLHASTQHEETAGSSSVNFGLGQSEAGQVFGTNSENGNQATSYGTQVSSDGQHVIHYEQSPVIDLSSVGADEKRKDSNDSSASSSTSTGAVEDPPLVLQNADGTYGINATWYRGESSKISWPEDDGVDANVESATASSFANGFTSESGQHVRFEDVEASPSSPDVSAGSSSGSGQENKPSFTGYEDQSPRNDSSYQEHGFQGFEDSRNESETRQQSGNSQGPRQAAAGGASEVPELQQQNQQSNLYPGLINFGDRESFGFRHETPSGPTTEQPFLKALVQSYDNLKKGQNSDQRPSRDPATGEAWFDPRLLHTGEGFQPSRSHLDNSSEGNLKPANRPHGVKRNKQVQIIIPYTSQYTPKPFHPSPEDWSSKTTPGRTQARKIQVFETNREYLAEETRRVEDQVSHILQSLEKSSRAQEVTRSPAVAKANTSIDVLRLQKNIDNWTIQEYSRGTTVSTTVPKSSRPYLSPSKKIPDEYLTTTEPVLSVTDSMEDTRKEISNVLAGFSFNDLEHEGSASNRIDLPHVEVSSHNEVSSVLPEETKSTTATSVAPSTTERNYWEQLPVSISPLNKERVYVVTPQTVSTVPTNRKSKKSADKSSKNDDSKKSATKEAKDNFVQFESIERAYQVLPQAVNNLASASTGPATIPLWGIMEHEVYATAENQTTTPKSQILYSGQSKVAHTRQ